MDDIGYLNLNLREADRIFLEIESFTAKTFEELFENIKKIDWFDYLKIDDNFIVNARTYKSKLFSIPSIQSISEKAIIDSLKRDVYKRQVLRTRRVIVSKDNGE